MNIIDYGTESNARICAALGFFDCIHIGHRAIIQRTAEIARELNAVPALFTFSNDPFILLGNGKKPILTFEERLYELKKMGIDTVIKAEFNQNFMNTSGRDFFEGLIKSGVVGIASGVDYTCGAKGKTNVAALKEMAKESGTVVKTVDDVVLFGERVSSTRIRKALSEGDIKGAGELLGRPYIILSEVIRGDGLGKTFGFPTANLAVGEGKQLPLDGVYNGFTEIDGKSYGVVVHIGKRPTLNREELRIEAFIPKFSGDLYGKSLNIGLTDRIRGVKRFASVEELKNQIQKDVGSLE